MRARPTPCSRAWKRRFSRTRQLAVQQRLVAEEADAAAHAPRLARQLAPEHRSRGRRAGAAAWRGCAAASTCRRRWAPKTTSVAPGGERRTRRRAARRARRRRGRPLPARRPARAAGRGRAMAVAAEGVHDMASIGAMTGKSSSTAFGLPGKLTISVGRRCRDPRVRMPDRRAPRASARIASASPGASRSITARVASGVMSSGVKPVPPVVKTSAVAASTKWCRRSSISAKSSGTTSIADVAAGLSASSASRGRSGPRPRALRPGWRRSGRRCAPARERSAGANPGRRASTVSRRSRPVAETRSGPRTRPAARTARTPTPSARSVPSRSARAGCPARR